MGSITASFMFYSSDFNCFTGINCAIVFQLSSANVASIAFKERLALQLKISGLMLSTRHGNSHGNCLLSMNQEMP